MIRSASLRRLWWRWWFPPVATIIVAFNLLLVLCWQFHVWSWEALEVYGEMNKECHPVWRDFHFGKVRAGDDVGDVIAKTTPTKVKQQDRWTILTYKSGVGALAYDGRMVFACASSCAWVRVFFDEMTDQQSLDYFGKTARDPKRYGSISIVVK